MGCFVNLPAHRHRLHFQCEDHAKACDLEEAKILEAEYRDASGPWVLCLGHYSYFATITKISSGLRVSWACITENHADVGCSLKLRYEPYCLFACRFACSDPSLIAQTQPVALCEIHASHNFIDDLIWCLVDVDANRAARLFQS